MAKPMLTIWKQVHPKPQRYNQFRLMETIDTVDGYRTRIVDTAYSTLAQAQFEAGAIERREKYGPHAPGMMTRLAIMSVQGYFAKKAFSPWFSKWLSHEPAPPITEYPGETVFERYKRYTLARGDRILYMVHHKPKECRNVASVSNRK